MYCAACVLDQGLTNSPRIMLNAHKASFDPQDTSVVYSVYKDLLVINRKPTSNIHSDREGDENALHDEGT